MSETVLAIIEPDDYPDTVASRAAWLARKTGADLRLLMWSENTSLLLSSLIIIDEAQMISEQLREGELRLLEDIRDKVSGDDLVVTTSYRSDTALLDAILTECDQMAPSYVVKGTHYHRPAERASMSDIDWQLIRKMTSPLWFVKPRPFAEKPTIVTAVDPTHTNDKPAGLDQQIINQARKLEDSSASRLLILHTYQKLSEIGAKATWAIKPERLPIDDLETAIRTEHHQLVSELAERNRISKQQIFELPGRPHEILPSFCRTHNADLLIMGAVARSSIKTRVIGNTAQKTLDHVNCDVLIVHPDIAHKKGSLAA